MAISLLICQLPAEAGKPDAGCAMIRPMRSRIHAVAIPSEIGDFTDEVRRVFLELGRAFGAESLAGECAPAVDVYETDDAMEVTVDLPGVEPGARYPRVVAQQGEAGDRPPAPTTAA